MSYERAQDLFRRPPLTLVSIIQSLCERFGDEASEIVRNHLDDSKIFPFFALSEDIQTYVLLNWLSIHDLALLDCALCETAKRQTYLKILSHKRTVWHLSNFEFKVKSSNTSLIDSVQNMRNKLFENWVLKRKIKSRAVKLIDFVDFNELQELIDLFQESVQKVVLENCTISLRFMEWAYHTTEIGVQLQEIYLYCCSLSFQAEGMTNNLCLPLLLSQFRCLKIAEFANCRRRLIQEKNMSTDDREMVELLDKVEVLPHNCLEKLVVLQYDYAPNEFRALMSVARNVKFFDITGTNSVGISDFQSAFTSDCGGEILHNIQEFVVPFTSIDSMALLQLIPRFRLSGVTLIELSRCPNISSEVIWELIINCRTINSLGLAGLPLTEEILLAIPEYLVNISHLNISGCPGVTVKGITNIIKQCNNLSTFYMRGYSKEFDNQITEEIYKGKYWIGNWKDRKLQLFQSNN